MRPAPIAATVLLLVAAGAVLRTQATIGPTALWGADAKSAESVTGASTLYLMGAAHVPGFNDTQWRTSLEVCNFSGVTRSYQLGFLHRGQSNPDPETIDLGSAPGLCANYPDVVATVLRSR